MIFEFQREGSDGDWEALGISRTGDDGFDIDRAIAALDATQTLEPGTYRVRALEAERRWHFGVVDEGGAFEPIDEPAAALAPTLQAPGPLDSGDPRWSR